MVENHAFPSISSGIKVPEKKYHKRRKKRASGSEVVRLVH
jgi:hypothetical protein